MNLFSEFEDTFSPSRLELARMRRGLKQEELADLIGVDKTTISKYESGERCPDEVQAIKLAEALRFPREFFYQSDVGPFDIEGVSFRARRSEVKAAVRDRTLASLKMASSVLDVAMSRLFRLPDAAVPSITGVPPEVAADRLRSEWQLGPYPIPNVIHLLEAKGVRVFWFYEEDTAVDAISKVQDSIPFALLSQRERGGERMRFDLAHELGHLVMHRGQNELHAKTIEDEANAFASAFLVPEDQFRKECPRQPSLSSLLNMKQRWGVSLQALVHRCLDLGIYTESQYKSAFRRITANGWRINEPGALPREESKIWELILDHLAQQNRSIELFAAQLHLYEDELYNLVPLAKKRSEDASRQMRDHFLDIHELGYKGPVE